MKNYKLPQSVLEGIVKYLATRPYAEVSEGIQTLLKLEEIQDEVKSE